jgi:hypothetical protein
MFTLSYAAALSYPENSKVVAMSGYLNFRNCAEDYFKNNFTGKIFLFPHGTVDQVIQ